MICECSESALLREALTALMASNGLGNFSSQWFQELSVLEVVKTLHHFPKMWRRF